MTQISRTGDCLAGNCAAPRKGRGYCAKHWSKWRKYGDPNVVVQVQVHHTLMPDGSSPYDSPEYSVWCAMKARCKNPTNPEYHNYGARGITVCERWKEVGGFQNFIEDMGMRTDSKHSLDRIDNNKGYSPENCRWATSIVQNQNKRMDYRNKSGYVGVFWLKRLNKWLAYIQVDGKRKHLGLFVNKLDAAIERDKWAKDIYGKYAKLNIREKS